MKTLVLFQKIYSIYATHFLWKDRPRTLWKQYINTKNIKKRISNFHKKYIIYKESYTNHSIINKLETDSIMNLKELQYFTLINKESSIPEDIFNIICNKIIEEMKDHANLDFTKFRDTIYDILVYNLDTAECIYYVLSYFIENDMLSQHDTSEILTKIYPFLKYYNVN